MHSFYHCSNILIFFLSQRNIGACYALYVERVLDFQCLDLKIMFAGRKLREHASFFAFFRPANFFILYVPSHPHARSQESKIFGRVFLPLNASGRIFRL